MDGRFEQGKIYKLVSKMTTKIYLGSTILPLKERLSKHKADYKSYLKKKRSYLTSFELLKHEDVDIELIEDYPYVSKNDLEAREGEWIKELSQSQIVCVNKVLPGQKKGGSYQDGKIYRLFSKLTDKIYIGSTILPLNGRLSKHKSDYRRFLNQKGQYLTSFELLQHEDVDIELIENHPCASKKELELREGVVVKENQEICVNKIFPGRTKKEYREEHKDKISEQKANYYEGNRDKIKERQSNYYQEHKNKIKERQSNYYQEQKDMILDYQMKYREEHKEKIKEQKAKHYEEHKDKIKEQKAKYYEDNKDKKLDYQARYYEEHKNKSLEYQMKYREEHKEKIKEQKAKQFPCECGSTVSSSNRAKHLKTKKHKDFISTQSKEN